MTPAPSPRSAQQIATTSPRNVPSAHENCVSGPRRRRNRRDQLAGWLEQEHDLAPGSEERNFLIEQIVQKWCRRNPSMAVLDRAVVTLRGIYRMFNDQFPPYFAYDRSPGRRIIAATLRKRLPSVGRGKRQHMVDEVVEHVIERRLHLLRDVVQKFQANLAGPLTFKPEKLAGYFANTARIESYHVPPEVWNDQALSRQALVAAARKASEEPEPQPSHSPKLLRVLGALAGFYADRHGSHHFTAAQQIEGLVSSGAGFLSAEKPIARRARRFAGRRLKILEAKRNTLQIQFERLVRKREWKPSHYVFLQSQPRWEPADAAQPACQSC